jgi:hypothetical protein
MRETIPFFHAAWLLILSAPEHEAYPSGEMQNGVSMGVGCFQVYTTRSTPFPAISERV